VTMRDGRIRGARPENAEGPPPSLDAAPPGVVPTRTAS
jgi:hypothetical protein